MTRRIAPFWDQEIQLGDLATTDGARFVASADLDGDGDLDLVTANERSDNLTVFFQSAPRIFASPALVLGGFVDDARTE